MIPVSAVEFEEFVACMWNVENGRRNTLFLILFVLRMCHEDTHYVEFLRFYTFDTNPFCCGALGCGGARERYDTNLNLQ